MPWPRSISRTICGLASSTTCSVSASFGEVPVERLVAAFVPIYFGRVGSLVIENRRLSEEQAEERVERQAREFELLKPYLVERWRAASAGAHVTPGSAVGGGGEAGGAGGAGGAVGAGHAGGAGDGQEGVTGSAARRGPESAAG